MPNDAANGKADSGYDTIIRLHCADSGQMPQEQGVRANGKRRLARVVRWTP